MSKSLTVIVNCFNGEAYLSNALHSLVAQNDKNFSVIFFDNASTDTSVQIAKEYSDRLSIQIVSKTVNVPLGLARNEALSLVNTDLVSFLDVDDEYSPNRITISKKAHLNHNAQVIFGSFKIIDSIGNVAKTVILPEKPYGFGELLEQYNVNFSTCSFCALFLRENGFNFDSSFQYCPDYDLVLHSTLRGSAHSISDILSNYRVHSNALSSKTLDRVPIELTRIRHRHQHHIANANLTTNRLNDRIRFARLTACVIGSRAISYRRIRALRASKWIKPIFWLIFFIPTAPLRKFVIQQIRRRPL